MAEALEAMKRTRTLRKRQRVLAGLARSFARVELLVDRVAWGLRRRFGRLGPLQIVAYRSFGTPLGVVLRGRVLEASILERSLPTDSAFRSFRRMLRRFFSRELPEATVRAQLGMSATAGTTDDEGYFEIPVVSSALADAGAWKSAEVEVVAAKV